MVRTIQSFELFEEKKWLENFGKRFCNCINSLMLNYEFKDYHLSVFQKLWESNTCNQVKSGTKYGSPNQS